MPSVTSTHKSGGDDGLANRLNTSYDDSHTVFVSIRVNNRNLTIAVLFDRVAEKGNLVSKEVA